MITKSKIEKINAGLRKGDKVRIAKLAGVSNPTVTRFFNNDLDLVSDESKEKIIDAIHHLKNERSKKGRNLDKKIESIIKSA